MKIILVLACIALAYASNHASDIPNDCFKKVREVSDSSKCIQHDLACRNHRDGHNESSQECADAFAKCICTQLFIDCTHHRLVFVPQVPTCTSRLNICKKDCKTIVKENK